MRRSERAIPGFLSASDDIMRCIAQLGRAMAEGRDPREGETRDLSGLGSSVARR